MVDIANRNYKDGSLPMALGGELRFYRLKDGGDWFVRASANLPTGKEVDVLYPVNVLGEKVSWGTTLGDSQVTHSLFWNNDQLVGISALSDGRFSSWEVISSKGQIPLKKTVGSFSSL